MSERVILFRFHTDADVCAQRIHILQDQNPDVDIYGIGERIDGINKLYAAGMKDLYTINNKTDRWFWKHGDLFIRKWFIDVGSDIDFTMVHIFEWDLLYTKSLDSLFPNPRKTDVYLSGLISKEKAKQHDWDWVTSAHRSLELYDAFVSQNWDTDPYSELRFGLFPGVSLGRTFLQKYAEPEMIPEYCNDEARVSVTASRLENITLKDTGFYDNWGNTEVSSFNSRNHIIQPAIVQEENKDAYHPIREQIPTEMRKLL